MSKSLYIFANPFLNHSYFTTLALTTHTRLLLFCPPLQIQFLLGVWKFTPSISIHTSPLYILYSSIFISIYIFYKIRLFSHSFYITLFIHFLSSYISIIRSPFTLVFYQDYLDQLLPLLPLRSTTICELIIDTAPGSSNYSSTLSSIKYSDYLFIPSKSLIHLVHAFQDKIHLAPYGGDKTDYILYSKPRATFKPSLDSYTDLYTREFLIVARCPTIRKGADIFLRSLVSLNSFLSQCLPTVSVKVIIAGHISDQSLSLLYNETKSHLELSGQIKLQTGQLSQQGYLSTLEASDLFVMPSRLEGSSLAALEALWLGIPSILSPFCGIDFFKNNKHGLLLKDLDECDLAQCIYYFLSTPSRLSVCQNFLAQDRDLFSWQHYLNSYRSLIASIN